MFFMCFLLFFYLSQVSPFPITIINSIEIKIEKAKRKNSCIKCQPIANNSILPTNQIFHTQNRLRDFDIDCRKILKLINGLNPNKAHGHDGISIRMVKLCNLTITEPL